MRTLLWIVTAALLALWTWFAVSVAPAGTPMPRPVEVRSAEPSAATINNEGVRFAKQRRPADALACFERAHAFRPDDAVIARNLASARAYVAKRGWLRALVPASVLAAVLWAVSLVWGGGRRLFDRVRLARLRVRGDPWVKVDPDAERAELPLRFSEPVDGLLKRNPLTIVWSSSRHGKHMKSKPPVEARGRRCHVRLDENRLARLRRYPGDWKGFLYVGKTQVGEAFARVG